MSDYQDGYQGRKQRTPTSLNDSIRQNREHSRGQSDASVHSSAGSNDLYQYRPSSADGPSTYEAEQHLARLIGTCFKYALLLVLCRPLIMCMANPIAFAYDFLRTFDSALALSGSHKDEWSLYVYIAIVISNVAALRFLHAKYTFFWAVIMFSIGAYLFSIEYAPSVLTEGRGFNYLGLSSDIFQYWFNAVSFSLIGFLLLIRMKVTGGKIF